MRLRIDAQKGRVVWVRSDGTERRAGSLDAYGYLCVCHRGTLQKVHRVIYEHVHGRLPAGMQVDHINGVRTDNRIANLRAVTNMQNCQNRHKANRNSKTGIKGVRWHTRLQKYVVQICAAGRVHHLGVFEEATEAAAMYADAAAFFHINNPSAERR